ncbi:NIPSNAP family protein [Bacillus sp. SCS-153A]|uniref:NIPSNAP family protein n=1 Tax=Rossellomorea sedimentorum TaxID=3115294 RepID=UPI003906588C
MIYRVRTYNVIAEKLDLFNEFFEEYLLPNQRKNGSILIGRWVDLAGEKVTAIWQYESLKAYEEIEERIRLTELHKKAQIRKKMIEPLFKDTKQEFWEMTGDYHRKEIFYETNNI